MINTTINPNTLALTKYVRTGNSFFMVAGKRDELKMYSAWGSGTNPSTLTAKQKDFLGPGQKLGVADNKVQ